MSKFAYKGLVEILHLNTRKEGPDDEKVLSADLKLHTVVPRSFLDFFEPTLGDCLFLDGGAVRNPLMGPIQFHNELRHYRLSAVGGTFNGVTAKKFTIEPKDINQISLTFSVSIQPSGDEFARLAEYLMDAIEIDLAPENGELDLDGVKEAAKNLADMALEDGTTLTITGGGKSVTIGERKAAS